MQAGRSATELAVLLLELASLIRARAMLSPGDSKLSAVFDRCARAWRADFGRHGPLALELSQEGFREIGGGGILHHARLADLLANLRWRDLQTLRFDADFDGDALAAFVHVLAEPGLRGADLASRLRSLVPVGIEVEPASATEPEIRAQVLAGGSAAASALNRSAEANAGGAEGANDLNGKAADAFGAAGVDPDSDTLPVGREARVSSLDLLLRELTDCTNLTSYLELTRRAVTEAERARDAGELFRVIDALAEHAETKESRLAEVARTFLGSLCQGGALSDLLERAARGAGTEQVRAAQILALAGEPVAAMVLDRMPAYPEIVQRERLVPLLLALGERAVPELMQRLERPDRDASRAAVHVLGMMQHPGAVARLAELGVGADPLLREEAARALVRIGTEDAVNGLARGLRGDRGVIISAVQHLGATGNARAVTPLGHALERALEAKDVELAKEILRALGRVGRPEANVIFGSVMRRKAGLTGRWLKDVKVAAASALSTVPGDQAVALLAEALESRDEPLRKAAQRALDRRAEAVARGARTR
ncbi:MAG TPA: HEAT repeat domain-containing protein [Myxococcota bacterium]|nr:HEAT repeat domain-containing protein [Myxococcota bacterium]